MIWNPEREFFAFSIGSIICIEDLKSGKQKILYSHYEDITVLSLRNDYSHMASASSYLLNLTTPNNNDSNVPKCQIIIWDCVKFDKIANLFHKNASNITCMSYSTDDRFLLTVSDYMCPSLMVWSTHDYTCLVCVESLNYVVNGIAWNHLKCNELVLCGQNKTLVNCLLEENSNRNGSLSFNELDIPLIISEVKILETIILNINIR